MHTLKFAAAFCLAALTLVSPGLTDEKAKPKTTGEPKTNTEVVSPNEEAKRSERSLVFKFKDIKGMHVRDADEKNLAKIEDLMIDMESGKVQYAALSFGGFAGVGNKLFAVPLSALTIKFRERDSHFT